MAITFILREREIYYMNFHKYLQYCMNRYINKDTIQATHCALLINKGNHIVHSFEG